MKNHKIVISQILRKLWVKYPSAAEPILNDLKLHDADLLEAMDKLYDELIDSGEITECGSCGGAHRPDFRGDCRNDDERFPMI